MQARSISEGLRMALNNVHFYETDIGPIAIPDEIVTKVKEMQSHLSGFRPNDMRTRGARLLHAWATGAVKDA